MNTTFDNEMHFLDELDLEDDLPSGRLPRLKGLGPQGKPKKKQPAATPAMIANQHDDLRSYAFSYRAGRHEEGWLLDSLGPFYDEQWFEDVLRQVKGGKEASVYLCRGAAASEHALLAAKVYRPRALRNLRKDHLYREGRSRLDSDGIEIVDERMARAMQKRSEFGKKLMHTSWIEHEYRTLRKLHAAGCDVPQPYASAHNAILMDFIGDERTAAPTLHGNRLSKAQAGRLFEQLLHNLDRMLAVQRVHADLSAFNILYWQGELVLIDFPQAINPLRNPNAYLIFQRDLQRACEYFQDQGLQLNPTAIARDLWLRYGYSTDPHVLPASTSDESEADETEA
ncbi:MAG: hypothetical protein JW862_14195 [Anaerolineales bacterium]|nr:hypothetical protein [Anaerolineales bacterium]